MKNIDACSSLETSPVLPFSKLFLTRTFYRCCPHVRLLYAFIYLNAIACTSHHRKECEELEADERNIEMKIIKKQEELERSEKRYKSMENVRPQFMDEVKML
jgi:Clusterin-associated protein-1